MLAILALAVVYISPGSQQEERVLYMAADAEEEPVEIQEVTIDEIEPQDVEQLDTTEPALQLTENVLEQATEIGPAMDVDAAPLKVDLSAFSDLKAMHDDLAKDVGSVFGKGLEGRGAGMRGQLLRRYGGSSASEAAVAAALGWLVEHQRPDGSWSFDHRSGRCAGRCSDPGLVDDCFTGATAMALLPFLGAGQTHLKGKYKKNVEAGLAFLLQSMKPDGSLRQGKGNSGMYAHGLGAIALCEAYAMTQDRSLRGPAQSALNFIVYAQDPDGGGWRYRPRQPGDTSVTGWQLMALKSGHMASLQVPSSTIAGVTEFLNSVQTEGGAMYGYTSPSRKPSTTAVALLCRMYLGWKQDNPALKKGVEFLAKKGPSKTDMYYNYYAAQVLHHWGGKLWFQWNDKMRDQLVESQVKEGHAKGSWDVPDKSHANEKGGRLYVTCMATMILEVYYRHLPLYAKRTVEEEFPL